MLGYHDCPPHMFESLDPVYDAKWIRRIDKIALQYVPLDSKETPRLGGYIIDGFLPKRYK